MMIADNDLVSVQQARILAENASAAQKKLASFSQEKLDFIVEHTAEEVAKHAEALAADSFEETDCGRKEDKVRKNLFACRNLAEALRGLRCVGIIAEDAQAGTMDVGVPFGVIVALCPFTSPVSTTICKALSAIKSGNAVIFSPHPGAVRCISKALDIIIHAAEEAGLPSGCISYLRTVTKSGTAELMRHSATSLVLLTGTPGMYKIAREAGKPLICGGAGNGPAFVERTADIRQAAADIIIGKTFDYGTAPSAEQAVVVETCIADALRQALLEKGAHFMKDEESYALGRLFFHSDGRRKKGVSGISAPALARRAGFHVPESTTVLIAERKYVCDDDPYSGALPAPVLAWYVEDDWRDACEKCIELLLFEKNAHTMVIHSNDEEVIRQFALKKPVGRLLVNTPGALGGMGITTNLFPAMTLGCGAAGYGITADNVSPFNLVYIRKVARGVKPANRAVSPPAPLGGDQVEALRLILQEAAKVIGGTDKI